MSSPYAAIWPAALMMTCLFLPIRCLASEKARSFFLGSPGSAVRVLVPKKFEPLLPGSVYPNRKRPVAARGCPVAVVEGPPGFARRSEEYLLERGFLVVQARPAVDLTPLLEELAKHPEADPSRAVLLAWRRAERIGGARLAAIALFDPLDASGTGPQEPAAMAGSVAVFLRTPSRAPGGETSRELARRFGNDLTEKWYRGESEFPDQAFRDAAEWTAARLSRFR